MSKSEIESYLEKAPSSWSKAFESIIVYLSLNEPLEISFHSKDKVLGIHVSEIYTGNSVEVIEEIAIASQAIKEHGHFPTKLAKQKELKYRENWSEIRN